MEYQAPTTRTGVAAQFMAELTDSELDAVLRKGQAGTSRILWRAAQVEKLARVLDY